jgi:PAS domain S-box-containing protein
MKNIIKNDTDIRCSDCNKLIAKKTSYNLEIKCLRCGSLNNIFDEIKEQIVVTDKSGKILYVNHLVEKMNGYTFEEVVGKKPRELWAKNVSEELSNKWGEIVVGGGVFREKLKFEKKTGEQYEVDLVVSPIRNSSGEVEFLCGVSRSS